MIAQEKYRKLICPYCQGTQTVQIQYEGGIEYGNCTACYTVHFFKKENPRVRYRAAIRAVDREIRNILNEKKKRIFTKAL